MSFDWRNADEFPVRCANCNHWEPDYKLSRTWYRDGKYVGVEYGYCNLNAVTTCDAGETLVLMGGTGNCREYDDAFEPTVEAVYEYEQRLRECEDMEKTREQAWLAWKAS